MIHSSSGINERKGQGRISGSLGCRLAKAETRRDQQAANKNVEEIHILSVVIYVNELEGQGRISGSLEWRLAMGETRSDQATNGNVEVKFIQF